MPRAREAEVYRRWTRERALATAADAFPQCRSRSREEAVQPPKVAPLSRAADARELTRAASRRPRVVPRHNPGRAAIAWHSPSVAVGHTASNRGSRRAQPRVVPHPNVGRAAIA
jgi:hypothetical protein